MSSPGVWVLGLTGGIGSGKSTVAELFREQQVPVIDADRLGHEVLSDDAMAIEAVVTRFGKDILDADGQIDRQRLGQRVFSDPQELQALEAISHPAILRRLKEQIHRYEEQRKPLVVIDAALLFEIQVDAWCDEVWVVYCSEEQQIARVMRRSPWSEDQVRSRIRQQMSWDEKCARGDHVLDNTGTLEDLQRSFRCAWCELSRRLPRSIR